MRLFCRFSNILRLITLSPTLKSSLVALFKVEFSLEKPGLGILGILLLVKSSLVKLELSLENPGLGILERPPESVPMPELEEVEAAEVGLGRWLILRGRYWKEKREKIVNGDADRKV